MCGNSRFNPAYKCAQQRKAFLLTLPGIALESITGACLLAVMFIL